MEYVYTTFEKINLKSYQSCSLVKEVNDVCDFEYDLFHKQKLTETALQT